MRALALLAVLALAVIGLAGAVVYVESPVEIPPLAYFNGTHYKPVHVYYVATWEKAVWFGEVVEIPVWDFKCAVIYIPDEAFTATPPPNPLGVLEVAVEGKKALLVEAPDDVLTAYGYLKERPAEAKRANATWIRQPTKRGLGDKPTPRPGDAKGAGAEPLDVGTASSLVFPSGAFYFNKTTLYAAAGVEYCLPVRTSSHYSWPEHEPTLAVLGYNATRLWRVAWQIYYWGPPPRLGEVLGRGVAKVYVTDPELREKSQPWVVGEWDIVHLGGGAAFLFASAEIPPDLRDKHLALELCFKPSRSGIFTVGANATVGFVKSAFAYAVGDYYFGVERPAPALVYSSSTPFRSVLVGPFALADGYYSAEVEWHVVAEVPWPSANCPTLTARLYIRHIAEWPIDVATATPIRYDWGAGRCIYEVRRTTPLHSAVMGLWYDEARALEKGVYFRIELSHGADRLHVHKVEVRGKRYVENFIDKPRYEWVLGSHLRAFFTTVDVATDRTSPAQVNVEVLHSYNGGVSEFVNVYVASSPSHSSRILMVTVHVSPKDAYGSFWVFARGDEHYEVPWQISDPYRDIIKGLQDFLGLLPGPLSVILDAVLDVRSGARGFVSEEETPTGVLVRWRSGYAEGYRYVGIDLGTDRTITRTITVQEVWYDYRGYKAALINQSTTIPGVRFGDFGDIRDAMQYFRHWAHRVRLSADTPVRVAWEVG